MTSGMPDKAGETICKHFTNPIDCNQCRAERETSGEGAPPLPDKVFSHKRLAELAKQAIAAGETSGEGAEPAMKAQQFWDEKWWPDGFYGNCNKLDPIQFAEAYAAHRLAAAEAANRELERNQYQIIDERDRAQDALQKTHVNLGGDGEWVAKIPQELVPDSGDLHRDVPELARQLRAANRELRAALEAVGNLIGRPTTHYSPFNERKELLERIPKVFEIVKKALTAGTQGEP